MKLQNTKSSDELHQDVREEIRNVREDIDQLQGRFSPGQLIDDVIFYPHGQSPAATIDHLKRNPVGTAFLSLGTLLLMEDDSHRTVEANARVKLEEARTKLTHMKERVRNQFPHKEPVPGAAPNLADIAKGKVHEMKDSFQSKLSDIKQSLDSKIPSRDQGPTTYSSTLDDTQSIESTEFSGSANSAYQNVSSKLGPTLEASKNMIRDLDPMTYMALGAGLGAITGAALPVSEGEQRIVDERLQSQISSFNQELHVAVNECTSILKDLVIQDVKNFSAKIF